MLRWFLSLSIRWKLQLGFFTVTMITTIFNRMLASHELDKMVQIAQTNNVEPAVVEQLQANHSAYIFNSFWESGLEFAIQFMIIGVVASIFVRPIKALCDALKAMEQGDMTKGVKNTSFDEIGVLERSFNSMLNVLNNLLGNVNERGKEMGQSAYQIATISHEIAEISRHENQRSTEVGSATDQLSSISQTVEQLAQDAAHRAQKTEAHAQEGMSKVQENISLMQQTAQDVNQASHEIAELEAAAEKIHNIIGTINSIAEKTNLLSLNAAIEAARAGEQGRGFAVVADEVRSLSQSTSQSLDEISTIIDTLTGRVSQVTTTMGTVVERVQSTQERAHETADVINMMAAEASESAIAGNKITEASQEQGQQFLALKDTLNGLFETLGESSSKVETTAAIGDDLFNVTEKMKKLLSGFVFNYEEMIEQQQHEKREHPRAQHSLLTKINNGSGHIEGITTDLSLSGIQLRLPSEVKDAENVVMKIYLPYADIKQYKQQTPMCFSGKVVWSKLDEKNHREQYSYGIEFTNVSEEQRHQIKQAFEFFSKNIEYRQAV
ncbi:MAG: methyl-accepting chemotaxis protein [Gammaproteobacteria bacterium]|nr:methyl-accepting chemotaxis protein [Gammaproteobacteria bacterium]